MCISVITVARREMIWSQVCAYIEDGNAVIAWVAPNDAGFRLIPSAKIGAYQLTSMAFGWLL